MIVGVLLWMGQPSAFSQADNEPTQQELEQAAGVLQKLLDVTHGRFVLKGEVVDERGQRLNGVSVELDKSRLKNMGEAAEHDTENRTIYGTFDFAISGYISVRLTFSKAGYYSRRVEFAMPSSGEALANIAAGLVVEQQVFTKEGLRIVLEKVGQLADLKLYGGFLEYRSDGTGKVLDLDKSHIGRKPLQVVSNVHDSSQLPVNCVYFLAERGADGKILTEQVQRPRSYFVEVFPQRLTLIMNDPDGGFVVFAPPTRKNLYHQMKQAPEAGYQRELILEANTLKQGMWAPGRDPDASLHFFFKSSGKYGKGAIGDVVVEEGATKVRLGVELRIQPDGSRNVETDEGTLRDFTPTPTDTTPPVITILGGNPATVECHGTYTDAGATATDDKDGDLTAAIVISNTVNTTVVGTYTVTYTVRDAAGNPATATRTIKVHYQFAGFLPPIGGADASGGTVAQPLRTFKAGSKIPVKFTLACGGAAVTNGVHTLQVVNWSNETTAAEPIDASPADAATAGNQFRFTDEHWQYVLDTKATGMTVGTWALRATLSDGSVHSAFIALK